MRYITQIIGPSLTPKVRKKHADIAQFAAPIGYRRMPLFRYNDSGESDSELQHRLWGIVSGVRPGDTVIHQYPTGNSERYETQLRNEIRGKGADLALLIHHLPLKPDAAFLNSFDYIIAQTDRMVKKLRELGANLPMFTLNFHDYHVESEAAPKIYQRQVVFSGDVLAHPELKVWEGLSPLMVTGVNRADKVDNTQVKFVGSYVRGGLGLVMDKGGDSTPLELSQYLVDKLPVIVFDSLPVAEFIKRNQLGLVIKQVADLDQVLAKLTAEDYEEMAKRVAYFGELLRTGFFTQKVLSEVAAVEFMDEINGLARLKF